MVDQVISPFGGDSAFLDKLHVEELARRYKIKCGLDIAFAFNEIQYAKLYKCNKTEYKFWLPNELAGNEEFYKALSTAWPNYYQTNRWEFRHCQELVRKEDVCLEVGCGRGYFLKSIESHCRYSIGLEYNSEAIEQKICNSTILRQDVVTSLNDFKKFDKIFAFQVLEHISDPLFFLNGCLTCLKSKGFLIISVPNDENVIHQSLQDPFNLPPHHVGYYNTTVLSNISNLLGLQIVKILLQPAEFPFINVSEEVKNKPSWQIYFRVFRAIGRLLLKQLHEPGYSMLVVFRKP